MKALSAIATLPHVRSRSTRKAETRERADRVQLPPERSHKAKEWAWESDPILALAMHRMLGR
jgi:hypothetical protein